MTSLSSFLAMGTTRKKNTRLTASHRLAFRAAAQVHSGGGCSKCSRGWSGGEKERKRGVERERIGRRV